MEIYGMASSDFLTRSTYRSQLTNVNIAKKKALEIGNEIKYTSSMQDVFVVSLQDSLMTNEVRVQ